MDQSVQTAARCEGMRNHQNVHSVPGHSQCLGHFTLEACVLLAVLSHFVTRLSSLSWFSSQKTSGSLFSNGMEPTGGIHTKTAVPHLALQTLEARGLSEQGFCNFLTQSPCWHSIALLFLVLDIQAQFLRFSLRIQ